MKKINSTHMAKLLNVSQASVSRAFDLKSSMTNRRRTQILKRCIAEGYRVADAKLMLKTENPIRIAFLVNELHNPFFSSLINDFSEAIGEYDQYLLEIHVVADHSEYYLRGLLKNLQRTGVQSLISASHMKDSFLPDVAHDLNIPLIAINRSVIHSNASSVAADNYKNAYKVSEYLWGKGHRNIMFLADNRDVRTVQDRLQGCTNYMQSQQGGHLFTLSTDLSYDGAYNIIKNRGHLIKDKGITALIGGNDIMAIGAIDALRAEHSFHIPDDLNIFGFDDIPMASWQPYQLSTVRQRTRLMSRETIEILDMILNQKEAGLERKSQGTFILRHTA